MKREKILVFELYQTSSNLSGTSALSPREGAGISEARACLIPPSLPGHAATLYPNSARDEEQNTTTTVMARHCTR